MSFMTAQRSRRLFEAGMGGAAHARRTKKIAREIGSASKTEKIIQQKYEKSEKRGRAEDLARSSRKRSPPKKEAYRKNVRAAVQTAVRIKLLKEMENAPAGFCKPRTQRIENKQNAEKTGKSCRVILLRGRF